MRRIALAAAALCVSSQAFAWGPEGHSIVAEIAQRRLNAAAAAMVEKLLGRGHSLASVGSWADDVRNERPATYNWHFVSIPLALSDYQPGRDCRDDAARGDCVVKEIARLKRELRCAETDAQKAEALKYAVHFIGDIHQPLHAVLDDHGGNDFKVDVFMRGQVCLGKCVPQRTPSDLHTVWDVTLITRTVWAWGAYVDRLENGWLKTNTDPGDMAPESWAVTAHAAAREVWNAVPATMTLDDDYYRTALPVLDRQLGLGGLRLAKFLNDAYASTDCTAP
ncbi:S1/P1 nuclease [Bradyrhizobium prioriisuperbiae]|uniref:S1/P1 nuclease n=1 Tax=Bradyrhizobium prioriisuperbiae TaxID=2854389 RepID=UPI0028E1A5A4|nr:S1/P1 nuclease [Bradyrhizobium prioritasuperba]